MPWLPALGDLVVFDPLWQFRDSDGAEGICLLRVWQAEQGHFAIVTARDMGRSVTTAARAIRRRLVAQYGEQLALAEHWTAEQAPEAGEHVDLVLPPLWPGGQGWMPLWPVGKTAPHYEVCQAWWEAHGLEVSSVPS
jgi:hypothetical protein